ncbi:polyribonucleotide nucleotidyltransferase [Candidatus Falkowbacteria bacterium HGW-Falkowbacteria-1]|uniref:Polyribonucleotide nucleotidyltransferase n=1 Tax=Candidatus Falkowbacteria bacterium HGW-Falkowbacteria-1 TaxID=2013768 RepID=A0A2N2E8S7_9BACT|nr:MAG: polyribonucleotide nucleotidyltransferase [Candidatus Falkowbacteria bacterium HGW-Falkowbacteria-1]
MNEEKKVSGNWLGRELTIKTGRLAKQADASVLVQYGETVVMATVVQSKTERDGIDFFPLMVELEEKLYAAGIIKGSRWIKREGRPSDQSILTGRMIDRSIRPLFNDDERKDVQIILTVLSVDGENDHDIVSLIAASAVLSISGVDWRGPIGGIRVALIENKLVFNPNYEQQALSELDLIVVGTDKKVVMIEAGAKEIKEDLMFDAIKMGQENLQEAINIVKKFKNEVGVKEKEESKKMASQEDVKNKEKKEELLKIGENWLNENIKNILFEKTYYTKGERKMAVRIIKEGLNEYLFSQNIEKPDRDFVVKKLAEKMIEAEVTRGILEEKRRVDGRALNEIRELSSDTGILPRSHGNGLFNRGETQVLSIVTLGSPGMEQSLEGIEGQSKKRYMHHYNFPPFSVGEASPLRGTGRREIGHGALAEKALIPVLPKKEDFPYTIRVVSETLGSNGSSSMAATCGSSLALMDAGVPIKKPVAGIAMGLASNDDMSKWEVLTDIQDLEDGKGGMDFKITGTDEGLTAIQLDTKTDGLSEEIIRKTLTEGRNALNKVLESIKSSLPEPRKEMSPYAPRIISFHVNPEKIGSIIGPGGKIINKIIEETEVTIDIEDDGLVMICSTNQENAQRAEKMVKDLVREFEAGEIFTGKVVRLMDFGAFVEIAGGQDGMVHVSELAPYRIGKPSDFVKIGDAVQVKIKEIDSQGRINLTMKGLEENEILWKDKKGESAGDQNGFNRKPSFNKKF